MIRRLTLRNWRNYEDLDLRLGPGTTFIVAPNGVGKTSLIEAASWATFGVSRISQRPANAVRAGAGGAVATIELELPDRRVMTLIRSLPKKTGVIVPDPVVYLDDEEVSPARAADEAQQAYGADLTFLSRLTMPRRPLEHRDLSEIGLHDHLSRLFGVDKLLTAATELEERIKAQDKLINQARQGDPGSAGGLSELRRRVSARRGAYEAAAAAHDRVSQRLDRLREAQRDRERAREWRARAATFAAAIEDLARQAADQGLIEPPAAGGDQAAALEAILEDALATVSADLEALRLERATLTGQASAIEQHFATLRGAPGECPVCLRPLDADASAVAQAAHAEELRRLRAAAESLRAREAVAGDRQARAHGVLRDFRAVPKPGAQPVAAGADELSAEPGGDAALRAELQRLFMELVSRKSELDLAERELGDAQQDATAHSQLAELYARDAVLRASHAAVSATTRELLGQTIEPLTAEVNARWQQLFPQRGRLRTLPTGDVSREVNGERLPYSAFSTGERTGLVILLRLLVLEMATKVNFCWFDEPLEHLDPEARRHVAEALARASQAGPLRQIVVTTYEEPLARRLAERHPGHVSLVYVRQGPQVTT
jgi:DNA repair exonuclease SbcCD ATPase subunit